MREFNPICCMIPYKFKGFQCQQGYIWQCQYVAYGTVVQVTSKTFIKDLKDKIKVKIKLHVLSSSLSLLINAHINRTIVVISREEQIEGIIILRSHSLDVCLGSGVASTAVDGWYTLADGAQITDDTSFCWETGPFIHSQSISANSKWTMGTSHCFAS